MGGSAPRNTTTTTAVEYPPWLEGPMINNINLANNLADQMGQQGYQGYSPGDRIAPLNELQNQAISNIQGFTGQWTPFMNQANSALNSSNSIAMQAASNPFNIYGANAGFAGPGAMVQAGNLHGMNLSGYMNPYTDAVTNNALGKLEDQRQVQSVANADAANKAKAFGGSRHGVVDAQTNAAFAKQGADTALNAAQSNFGNAQQMAMNDINRNLQAQGMNQSAANQMAQFNAQLGHDANQFNAQMGFNSQLAGRQFGLDAARTLSGNAGMGSQLAGMYQNLGANDMNNLMTAGNMLQDQDQMYRDFGYQEFLNRQNFPVELLNLRYGAVNSTPYSPGSSTSSPIYRNRAGGFLGGASAGYGATGNPWGAALGGILGAWGG